ncbi:MAG: hemolysin family protein [Acholeplasmataceae bacterium]|nr:hemolysin family protein [Acholeplasmataceae bacterium]
MNTSDLNIVIALVILVFLSAFFSATETAFSSLNKVKLKHMVQNGHKNAARTLSLSERFDRVLITILIGNNIVNIASASLATVLFVRLIGGNSGITVSTAVMTTVVLIFGEITPKSLAKEIPEAYALAVTPIIMVLIILMTPLNLLFGNIQKLMNRVFDFEKGKTITEEELLTYVDEAKSEGEINENESDLIRSVIDFDDLRIEDIFTPRVNVVAVEVTDDLNQIKEAFRKSGYSRIPVYEKDMDHIKGIINHKDFYHDVLIDQKPLASIVQPAFYVTEYMGVHDLLTLLRKNQAHLAVVRDEFGGTVGVVTMEDILEELVGDIWDEHDQIIEEITTIDDHTFKVKGHASVDEVFDILGIEEDDSFDFSTVNGWVQEELGRIPKVGDHFVFRHLDVTVTNADKKKVLEILINVTDEGSMIN